MESLKPYNESFKVVPQKDCVKLLFAKELLNEQKKGFKVNTVFSVLGNGTVAVSVSAECVNLSKNLILPRLGVKMGIDKNYAIAQYFGKGP